MATLLLVTGSVELMLMTAGSMSRELRDGTLGLLFLTPLRPVELILGKLVATSVQSVYSVIAVAPGMASLLLIGGITFGDMERLVLVLILGLSTIACVGLAISITILNEIRALFVGLCAAMVLSVAPGLGIVAGMQFAGSTIYPANPLGYWRVILALFAISTVALVYASHRLRQAWSNSTEPAHPTRSAQSGDEARSPNSDAPSGNRVLPSAMLPGNLRPPRSFSALNPFGELLDRAVNARTALRTAFLLHLAQYAPEAILIFAPAFVSGPSAGTLWPFITVTSWLLYAASTILVAVPGARILHQLRSSGELELILTTLVTEGDISRCFANWFWAAVRPFVALDVCLRLFGIYGSWMKMGAADWPEVRKNLLSGGCFFVLRLAIGWMTIGGSFALGLWFAIRYRQYERGVGVNLIGSVVAPSVLSWFLSILAFRYFTGPVNGRTLMTTILVTSLHCLWSGFLIYWSRRMILTRSRELSALG
jgi:ABC-type transport system involved in cytochrome c biogenesis permease component